MHKTWQYYTLLEKKAALFCYVLVRTFGKKPPLPQKLTKNLRHASCGMTWPPHLEFASYATAMVLLHNGEQCDWLIPAVT